MKRQIRVRDVINAMARQVEQLEVTRDRMIKANPYDYSVEFLDCDAQSLRQGIAYLRTLPESIWVEL